VERKEGKITQVLSDLKKLLTFHFNYWERLKGPPKRLQHAIATYLNIEPTTPKMSQHIQHGGQTRATCCVEQCCDKLRWLVAIISSGI